MRIRAGISALAMIVAFSGVALAQTTVADVKSELGVLDGQIEQLRDELVRTGAARGLPTDPATALTRLDQLQAELKRLTDRVDVLTNDLRRVVDDASNRVGDIEFRLTELEGGDTSAKPPVTPLGGGITGPKPRPAAPQTAPADEADQMAVSEQADFDAAVAAAKAGDNTKAAQLFATFLETYPGGPLSTEAQFRRGEALSATNDWRGAARSYLDAFSGAPQGPQAPQALYRLAISLSRLGDTQNACLTLAEVDARYPGSAVSADVAAEKRTLRCE